MPSPQEIILQIGKEAGVTTDDIRSHKRTTYLVAVRWKVIKELRGLGLSTPEIGSFLERDHTTVLHALKNMKQ